MCGIVGFVGARDAQPILLEGLRSLEYRGYDSAGLATVSGGTLQIRKRAGRIADLEDLIEKHPASGQIGISHTRWATHGAPNDINAHPHIGGDGIVAVVHNGVIENYTTLRSRLIEQGFRFVSNTDTEVIAHLIASLVDEDAESHGGDFQIHFIAAVEKALRQLKGTYGLAILSPRCPDLLIGARLGSPLVLGVGQGENLLASDQSALVRHTERVVFLNDGEMVCMTAGDFSIQHRDSGHVEPSILQIEYAADDAEKGLFEHYMLKEIFEQPESVQNAMRGRLDEEDRKSVV